MKEKKFFLFTAVLLFFAISFCFGGGKQASASSSEPLNVLMWTRDIAVSGDMEYYRNLTAQTGIKTNISTVNDSEWTTRLNLMFASGDYADVILRGSVDIERYGVDQKIIIPLEDHFGKYMPTYNTLLARDPSLKDYMRASDGHIYYTGFLLPQNINIERHLFINKVWLDKAGLGIPKTLTELENALRAFKDKDLNGNGRNDEFPLSGIMEGNESILEFLSFFGIPYRGSPIWLNITDDNKIVSQLQHQNFRPAMEALNR